MTTVRRNCFVNLKDGFTAEVNWSYDGETGEILSERIIIHQKDGAS